MFCCLRRSWLSRKEVASLGILPISELHTSKVIEVVLSVAILITTVNACDVVDFFRIPQVCHVVLETFLLAIPYTSHEVVIPTTLSLLLASCLRLPSGADCSSLAEKQSGDTQTT